MRQRLELRQDHATYNKYPKGNSECCLKRFYSTSQYSGGAIQNVGVCLDHHTDKEVAQAYMGEEAEAVHESRH